jgi:hypothetical protein
MYRLAANCYRPTAVQLIETVNRYCFIVNPPVLYGRIHACISILYKPGGFADGETGVR